MIPGATLALAHLANVTTWRPCGGWDTCKLCDLELRQEFRDWLTDQAIKQGLRSNPDAGEGV